MRIRAITRTHYQVDEPRYIEVLVTQCASPVKSAYKETVASCFRSAMAKLRREVNPVAAKYAVDLAKHLGLLTDALVWTKLGHFLRLMSGAPQADDELGLTARERVAFFRLFLEADGAALLFFAQKAVELGYLSPGSSSWKDLANEMLVWVYSSYIDLVTDLEAKTDLRHRIERRRKKPFAGKSGPHQVFVHLQAMTRIGLLDRENEAASRIYRPNGMTMRFLRKIPAIPALERILAGRTWAEAAVTVLQDPERCRSENDSGQGEGIFALLKGFYTRVMHTGVPLCPLDTVIEAVQAHLLAAGHRPISHSQAMDTLRVKQRERPKDVRFHVDRMGRAAYLVLSEDV